VKRWKPTQRSATTSANAVVRIRSEETAATVGSTPNSMAVKIFTGKVVVPTPVRKIETGTLSKDVMKANSAPAAMPGRISGSVTLTKAVRRLAPRVQAASSSSASRPARLASVVRTT
jgi:hypothetical protein